MEAITPKVLCDLYSMFSQADKDDVLKRIARISTAREPLIMANELTPSQQQEFSRRTFGDMVKWLMPLFVTHAIRVVKENPGLDNEELKRKLDATVTDVVELAVKNAADLEREKFKEARDPKPRFEERDAEIVLLRDQILPDGKQRTYGQIILLMKDKWPTLTRSAAIRAYNRLKNKTK